MKHLIPALIAIACLAGAVRAQDAPPVALRPTTIRAGSAEYSAQAGKLTVPENRSAEGSGTLELAFLRLESTAAEPGPPLVFLPGGPGNSATPMAESPVWARFLELGDVVLMDPRGVGRSEPDLAWSSPRIQSELFFGDRDTAVGHMAEVCVAAAEYYLEQGVDLRGYNALEMADDIDDLRRALEYERVNLMGHSFGTLLGLSILRRHPGSVERFVSIGTAGTGDMMKLPAELDASLRDLADLVADDPTVGEAMPDLYATLERVVASVEAEPLLVPIRDPRTGETREAQLGPFGVRFLLLADLGDTNDLPVYPRLLHSLEARDPSTVSWFLQKRVDQFSELPIMMLAVRGAAGATPARWERIQSEAETSPFGLARCMFSPESDLALGVEDLGNAFRGPVESDVPTLFVSGTLDAHTPPEQAERVREGFSRSGHVVVEYGGHEDLMPNPDVQALILEFLAGAEPEDVLLEGSPPRFARLEGSDRSVDHPALPR